GCGLERFVSLHHNWARSAPARSAPQKASVAAAALAAALHADQSSEHTECGTSALARRENGPRILAPDPTSPRLCRYSRTPTFLLTLDAPRSDVGRSPAYSTAG